MSTYNKVAFNNQVLIDLSQDTVISASHILSGYVGHLADGTSVTETLEATTLTTVSETANMKLQCRFGYYGGAINGAIVFVEYDVPGATVDHYIYTYTVDGDATIAVTIGAIAQNAVYVKIGGTLVEAVKIFKKVNGSWVEQSDLTTVFDSGTNYKYG